MSDNAPETSVSVRKQERREQAPRRLGKLRFVDFLIVVFCISGAVYTFNLFRLDLFATITLINEEPVGFILAKNNIVQRRLSARVLWDRLALDSPVYLGDLIRVAGHSSATLYIDGTHINLNENTLIRIQRSPDEEEAVFQIALDVGSLSLSADEHGGTIMLNLVGYQVQASPGTVLNAAAGDYGMRLMVSEGAVLFIDAEEGESRELVSGEMISLDTEGAERTDPAVVVMNPPPAARFLKNTPEGLPVNFAWNRLHLEPHELLRLELAEDRNFNRVAQIIEGLGYTAQAVFGAGSWHWRLLFEDTVLSTGQITVTEATGPELMSPLTDITFRFLGDYPSVRFQWSEIEGAASYIFEASSTANFAYPEITRHSGAAFFVDSNMGPGTWHWRVMPVFPPIYEGSAVFSTVAFFHIEQQGDIYEEAELVIALPEPIEIDLLSPAHGTTMATSPGMTVTLQQTVFTWNSDGEELHSRFVLSRNSDPFGGGYAGEPAVEITNPWNRTVSLDNLEQGIWYWGVEAQGANGLVGRSETRQLQVLPQPIGITLQSPTPGAQMPGLAALRQQTVFSWNSDGDEVQSRFVLSRNSNPFTGQPAVEIANPAGRIVTLDRLEQGAWFWAVEAQGANGLVTTTPSRQFQVLPIPLLPEPWNRLPAHGFRIGIEELRRQRNLVFSWSVVPGANAYIFAFYEQTPEGRREIIRTGPEAQTSWILENISVLDRGVFIWQVEAVNIGLNNVIEQRGIIAENSFVMDIPLPGPVRVETPGIFYAR